MGGGAEKQQLGCTEPQHVTADDIGAVGQALDEVAEHGIDLAQAAQRRGQQQADEGSIARIEGGKAGMSGQRVVQRLALVEAGHQHIERDAPGGERCIHWTAL